MSRFTEERAAAARLALRIPGFPSRSDTARLLDWLGDCVLVGCAPGRRAAMVPMEDRRALILLPRGLTAAEIDRAALEEIAHFLCSHGAALFFQREGDMETRRDYRLARVWEWREEAEVREFILAWLLPAELVARGGTERELAERSGCDPELVRARRERLRANPFALEEPPRWCAWRGFRVSYHACPLRPALRISRRCLAPDASGIAFEFPVTAAARAELQFQLNADLMALREDEFGLKYRYALCRGDEDATLDLPALRARLRS